MKKNNSSIDFLHSKAQTKKIYINKKDKLNLTICFCQCDCDCHKNTTQTNHNQYHQYSNIIPKKLNLIKEKRNSFSQNFSNPIKKEYSFDYYNNNTEMNPKLTRETIDNKVFLNSRSDNNNLDGKTDEFVTKESLISNKENDLYNNMNKNKKEFNNRNNFTDNENEFILCINDIKDIKQFIQTLHDIKKEAKNMPKSSSLKNFKTNTRPNIKNKIDNINNINKEKNKSEDVKMNINVVYDNIGNSLFNDNKKKINKIYLDKKYNTQYSTDNNNKTSIMNCSNNISNKSLKTSRSQNNYLLYNINNKDKDVYDTKNSSYIINYKYYKYYDYNENKIQDIDNKLYFKYNNNEINNNANNNSNPLNHIVDNFASMLKYKNHKNKLNLNNKYLNYNENIMKKKENLDKMCLNKIPSHNFIIKDYKFKEYNDKNNINNINNIYNNYNNYNTNKKCFNNKKKEYEKKYVKKNGVSKNNKKSRKIINKCENLIKEPKSIYDNNQMHKFAKYKEEKNKSKENYEYPYINKVPYYKIQDLDLLKDKNTKNNLNYNNQYNSISISNKINKNENILQVEKFDVLIRNNKISNVSKKYTNINEFQITNSKINKKIEIQNLSNITYYPNSKNEVNNPNNYGTKANNILSKQNVEQTQILTPIKSLNKKDKNINTETVPEKVRKLIFQKSIINSYINDIHLSSKLNLDTNLSLSEENETLNDNINSIKRNIPYSSNTIFTIYYVYEKPLILAFDMENKFFSFQNFSDFGNFEENYKLSKNFGNIFLTINNNLYVVTGKNLDMFYMFDGTKKTMNKLCRLKNNHCNGNLIHYKNNIICLSGDYNKKVEIYSIKKNQWDYLPDVLVERSKSATCIIDNKESNNDYVLNIFGYNYPSKEYLNTIEYIDLFNKDSSWKYLKYSNDNNILLNISNFFCINYEENKIILIGGCNENENIYNDKYIEISLGKNIEKIVNLKEKDRKIKDIDINQKYYFDNGYKFNDYTNKKEIFYEIFDSEYNCHVIHGNKNNFVHDIFYFCN